MYFTFYLASFFLVSTETPNCNYHKLLLHVTNSFKCDSIHKYECDMNKTPNFIFLSESKPEL